MVTGKCVVTRGITGRKKRTITRAAYMAQDLKQKFHDILGGNAQEGDDTLPFLVSAWKHVVGHEYGPYEQAQAQIGFVRQWDWQWVKINPRSAYYAESWGVVFDQYDYGGGRSPRQVTALIHTPQDLAKVKRLDPEKIAPLREQVESVRQTTAALDDRIVLQTVFSPLTVLLHLAALPRINGRKLYGIDPSLTADELLSDGRAAKQALQAIAETLADYVTLLVTPREQGGAGADGIFYAVTGTASRGYFTREQYREFAEPYDRIVLQAAGDAVKLLHTCRDRSNPDWFKDYGIDLLQWDQFLEGNPPIDADADVSATPVGGPDTALLSSDSSIEEFNDEIAQTIHRRAGHPFLLAPSCTVPAVYEDARLRILRDTSRLS